MSKAIENIKLVEVTIVIAVQTFDGNEMVSGMDYISVDDAWATVVGWDERDLMIVPALCPSCEESDIK